MNDQQLKHELEAVGRRDRQVAVRGMFAALWLALALAACALIVRGRGAAAGDAIWLLALPLIIVLVLIVPRALARVRSTRDSTWLGRRIENHFPSLNARLMTALEQRPKTPGGELGYLQQSVIGEALEHARANPWREVVPPKRHRAAT